MYEPNNCSECMYLEGQLDYIYEQNDHLHTDLKEMRNLALEALSNWESWVKDQMEGTSSFETLMKEVDELRNRINGV